MASSDLKTTSREYICLLPRQGHRTEKIWRIRCSHSSCNEHVHPYVLFQIQEVKKSKGIHRAKMSQTKDRIPQEIINNCQVK